ncbi:hypothetical protein MBLNU457_3679t1 [Dothideomycetes sp. NU457]
MGKDEKPYYITTPIFYVNAAPHVGHMYTMILADVMKRWAVLQGKRAILCTGTDEHGMKIQQAAQKAESDPKTFCDQGAEVFKTLAAQVGMSNDHFVRTTDPAHRETVEYVWHLLDERGLIYESKHEGWYSVSDETFYPESQVHLIVDPPTGRKIMVSIETGKEVQWTSERNYHFRLSAFRGRLLAWYKENPDWITPASRMKEVVASVQAGLEDLSVSRPVDRLTWGIRVPTDSTQTIYVWLDALLNYITMAGYPWQPGNEHAGGWPADVHVIGKDIVRFHCVYWPAFLMALNLPLPTRIMTHAHWTLGKQKMAKSTGNVVNPFFALDRFRLDAMRYFLVHNGGIVNDSDYDNRYIVERYLTDLKGGLGNLVARILRAKAWDLRQAVERYQSTKHLEFDCAQLQNGCRFSRPPDADGEHASVNRVLENFKDVVAGLSQDVKKHMDAMEPNKALGRITTHIYAANGFMQTQAPWEIAKRIQAEASGDAKKDRGGALSQKNIDTLQRRMECIIYLIAESLRIMGILLQPFMPDKAKQLLDSLGVSPDRREFQHAVICGDKDYGRSSVPAGQKAPALFMPLESDF